jgi:hypothetical protein
MNGCGATRVAMRDWVVSGKEPPASTYPTIARKSLGPLAQIKLPYVPATEFSPAGAATGARQRRGMARGGKEAPCSACMPRAWRLS